MSFPAYPEYKNSGVEWLGTVPVAWQVVRTFHLGVCIRTGKVDVNIQEEDGVYPFFTCSREAKKSRQFSFDCEALLVAGNGEVGYTQYYKGKFEAYQRTYVLSDFGDMNASFLQYHYMENLVVSVKGKSIGSVIQFITLSDLRDFPVPVPSRAEQTQIARFLDQETARIDALIEEQQRLIELLKEKRQAMISHIVTKGLDPTVPMKESGVEWLGEVPAHWEVKQLKHVVDPNTSITYGIVQAGPEFEGGIPYIRTSDMSGEELPASGYPLTAPDIDESYARSRVRPGDIVMSIRASVGKCLPVPDELKIANLTQGTAKISAGKQITRNFLLAFLNAEATQNYFDLMAKGATFKEITLDALRRTPVLLPPANEQIHIDQIVSRHAGLLDETCKQAIESISLLKERRSALISAAVTGKIDVRGWQPSARVPSPELEQEAV